MNGFVAIAGIVFLYFLYHVAIKCKEIYCLHNAKMLGGKKMNLFRLERDRLNKTGAFNVNEEWSCYYEN